MHHLTQQINLPEQEQYKFLNWEIEVSVRAIRESTKNFCDQFVCIITKDFEANSYGL